MNNLIRRFTAPQVATPQEIAYSERKKARKKAKRDKFVKERELARGPGISIEELMLRKRL